MFTVVPSVYPCLQRGISYTSLLSESCSSAKSWPHQRAALLLTEARTLYDGNKRQLSYTNTRSRACESVKKINSTYSGACGGSRGDGGAAATHHRLAHGPLEALDVDRSHSKPVATARLQHLHPRRACRALPCLWFICRPPRGVCVPGLVYSGTVAPAAMRRVGREQEQGQARSGRRTV